MLKTYIKHHYIRAPLRVLIVDNGSTDGSKEWLRTNEIPFISLPRNAGHSEVLNLVWNKIQTKYLLLVDSDIEFRDNVFTYIPLLKDNCASVGAITHNPPIHPRIAPWFHLLDYQRCKDAGIHAHRGEGNTDWSYDTGSWLWEKIQQAGLTNHDIWMREWYKGMYFHEYEKVNHYGQVSSAQPNSEIPLRHAQIIKNLALYKDIDLRGKFIGENTTWSEEFLTAQLAKGWWPIYYDS